MSLTDDPEIEKMIGPGMVVILRPDTCKNKMLIGCMMTITEKKSWGCVGYIQTPGKNNLSGGQVYYRANWEEMEFSGFNNWGVR